MAQYVIGLDFGTYQTKVCINHLDKVPSLHEFFEFKNTKNEGLFLPSKVFLLDDNTFRYGIYTGDNIHQTYNYFKIASAEDPIFHLLSEYRKPIYNIENNFGEFAPELLSVIYITSILLEVKEHLKSSDNSVKKKFSLSNFFKKKEQTVNEEVEFFIRLGVPTEWNKKINLARRRKFEMILLVSEMLQEHLNYSLPEFIQLSKDKAIKIIKGITEELIDSENNFSEFLGKYKISVSPESAAGLLYLIQTKKLNTGLYAAIDIGGGTSDISFFNIDAESKIKYLASESLMVASNNIYMSYMDDIGLNQNEINQVENQIFELIDSGNWKDDKKYIQCSNGVKCHINRELKILFSKPVWQALVPKFNYQNVLKAYDGKPCLIYGGGIKHPKLKSWNDILIFNNGATQTYLSPYGVDSFAPNQDKVKNVSKKWYKDFYMLVVAFGLSYLRHDSEAEEWDDSQYETTNTKQKMIEVPHPRNEGFYIYDVVERKWYDRN